LTNFAVMHKYRNILDDLNYEAARKNSRSLTASFSSLFISILWTVLHENYGKTDLRADVMAGLTMAIIALPLSMTFASGVTSNRGLYTSIFGGFIVSAPGGAAFRLAARLAPISCSFGRQFNFMVSMS
jgi:Sulfate permease family